MSILMKGKLRRELQRYMVVIVERAHGPGQAREGIVVRRLVRAFVKSAGAP